MTTSPSPSLSQASACPGCGADLVFNPTLGKLSCPYCDRSSTVIGNAATVEEINLSTWQRRSISHTSLTQKALEVECDGCHAQITFEPPEVAGDCPFCGTHITAQAESADPVITPGGILPFKVGRKEGRKKLVEWLQTRWFAPSSLKQLAQHEALQGVYLPFWTYDCQTRTSYSGERGTYYYVTKTRRVKNADGEWETEEYQERRTRWRSVSGSVSRFFDDILVPASKTVDSDRLSKIGPWPLKSLSAYDAAFLRGFRTQRYQVSLDQGFTRAQGIMRSFITADIESDIGGDEQRIHSRDTVYQDQTFKHILLPVWMATYRFKNQPYQVVINGHSGKVVGDRPYCPYKIAGAVSGVLVAIGTLWGGYSYSQGHWQLPTWVTNPGTLGPSLPMPNQSSPAPTSNSPAPPASAPSGETSTPVAGTTASPDPAFAAGLSVAYEAATKTQAAQSQAEWQEVSTLWAEAIDTLKQVPADDPNAAIAQQKIQEYQKNLNYAREQAAKAS
ncbi:MAG: hypothetical protein ACFBSG_14820 [Leptolyngbyaceae cyanobacterium]